MIDLRQCIYFFLPVNPECSTTTTSTTIPVTTTTTSTSTTSTSTSTTTSTSTSTSTTTTSTSTSTTTTTTTIAPEIYGLLYNWFAASDARIAESGWHCPNATEWYNLGIALGGTPHYPSVYMVGHKIKSVGNETDGTGLWKKSTNAANEGTNSSGMNATPSGVIRQDGTPGSRTTDANFWTTDQQSATKGKYFNLNYNSQNLYRSVDYYEKQWGFSIRLVRDSITGWNPGDTYTDFDGNIYDTALMADGKVWLTQNLRTQHFNDGTPIVVNPIDWSTRITGALHTY